MLASLRAEALKLRRLWLPAIAAGAGLLLTALAGLSLFGAAERLRTERSMDMPWQNGVIGDITVTTILALPTLVTLLTGLAFFVEHRGDMWKQLRVTPRPPLAIHAAKFVLIQALLALALLVALAAALAGWHLLPQPLREEMGISDGAAYANLTWLAVMLFLSLLPVSLLQFLLSARMPNILHPVAIGIGLTFASLMLYGPATARYLPYAWPGAVIMASFPAPGAGEIQQPDGAYRPSPEALAGKRPRHGAILFDAAHGNRHLAGPENAPGSLNWLAFAARNARIAVRRSAEPFSQRALAGVDLLIIGAAATPLARPEVDAVADWVRRGGALLLLTDHEPFASPSEALATRLGVGMSLEMIAGDTPGSNRRDFRRGRGPSGDAVGPVRTYGGQALWRRDGQRLLPLEGTIPAASGGTITPDAPAAQVLAFDYGRGRVVVSGESGLFGAQGNERGPVGVNDGETRNQAFVLETVRWLLRLGRRIG